MLMKLWKQFCDKESEDVVKGYDFNKICWMQGVMMGGTGRGRGDGDVVAAKSG